MKQSPSTLYVIGLVLSLCATPLWAQSKASGAKKAKQAPETTVAVDFDEAPKEEVRDDAFYARPIEQAFKNSPIAVGLASGADAINRSVESLMDSLFYSLLDNEFNLRIYEDEAWFNTRLSRELYSTPSGAYVVVERIGLGPRYGKELWRVQDVPVSIGIDNSVEVLQIYLRTDGMRLAEQNELSPTRRLINNWFGLLPAAAMLMPPSFNENELYDPVRQLETPFVFPLEVDGFYGMPVGSIRSYALSGGVRFPIDFGGMIDPGTKHLLDRTGNLTEAIPYSIFKTGEHRINVLRHGEHSAWVGLSEIDRTGHSISPLVGAKYFILKGALAARAWDYKWVWQGVPVAVLPIDLNFEQAIADVFDQVYEYDLRNPAAQKAYLAAVRGDFVPSRESYLDWKERDIDTGVIFHFARTTDKNETVSTNGPNLAVYRRERQRQHSEAEIEITDQEGKFYVLEVNHDVADKTWDILVGEEEQRVQQTLEMKVRRVLDKDEATGEETFFYAFDVDEDPVRLLLNLNIQDRYIDVEEYDNYIAAVRYFTALPLSTVPDIGLRDEQLLRERRRYAYFDEPGTATSLHVPPTYLGRFGAQASISFSSKQLKNILDTEENDMWRAFAEAYGEDAVEWSNPEFRASLGHQLTWFKPFLLYPLRLFNRRFAAVDAIKEASQGVKELMALKGLSRPADMIDGFYRVFDTDHPPQLTRALLNMSNLGELPRRVTFSAQPKGKARAAIKDLYGKLNSMTFKDGPAFPEPGRYSRAKAKLSTFYLGRPREAEEKPSIAKVQVTTRPIPASVRDLPDPEDKSKKIDRKAKHVYLSLTVNRLDPGRSAKIYVRVEQAGRVQIGKLELAEQVLELTPTQVQSDNELTTQTFEFYLTGPLSPLSSFLFDNAVSSGDQFLVTLGASDDGNVWTDERSVEFRYEKGKLGAPQ